MKYDFVSNDSLENFDWYNKPNLFWSDRGLNITTKKDTDFWQRTHYGFRRDNGHFLYTKIKGDFSISTKVFFSSACQYDQAGLMIRADENNWIKCSIEFDPPPLNSKLGSVVTTNGFSDWATVDIQHSSNSMNYKITRKSDSFYIYSSYDNIRWTQMRITHFSPGIELQAGIYACSPTQFGAEFTCRFEFIDIQQS